MENLNIVAITQARVGSSRLPGKVLLKVGNETLLDLHLKRIRKSQRVTQVAVATTHEAGSDQICTIASRNQSYSFKGATDDVLDRFYRTALSVSADWVIRLTSDCPLIDAELLDKVIETAINGDYDYCANNLVEDFPDGQDMEVFKMGALKEAWSNAKKKSEREHVTPYIRNHSDFNGRKLFKAHDYAAPENYNRVRMTVDEPDDLVTLTWLISELGVDKTWLDYTKHILRFPEKVSNMTIVRNEGYLKSLRQENR